MNDVPTRHDIQINPTDLRSLAEKMHHEYELNTRPQADAYLERLSSTGSNRGIDSDSRLWVGKTELDYAGRDVGDALATNMRQVETWFECYREGIVSLATGLAVTSEQTAESDAMNASELNDAFTPPIGN